MLGVGVIVLLGTVVRVGIRVLVGYRVFVGVDVVVAVLVVVDVNVDAGVGGVPTTEKFPDLLNTNPVNIWTSYTPGSHFCGSGFQSE